MRLLDAVRSVSEHLDGAGIDDPLADAEVIVYHAAATDRLTAFIDNPEIDKKTYRKIMRLADRRAKGEPVQYIVGHVDFLGLDLAVGPGVLIPRPETELLVEEAIRTVKSKRLKVKSAVLDLCTGSGCIALALARDLPGAEVIGTDLSQKALRYARKNAEANGILNARFIKGSLFEPVKREAKFDLITANPPYIVSREIPGLQREVKDWEPLSALDGGDDGLDFYREILGRAGGYLKPGGTIVLEMGYGQAGPLAALAEKNGFLVAGLIKDLCEIERILIANSKKAAYEL